MFADLCWPDFQSQDYMVQSLSVASFDRMPLDPTPSLSRGRCTSHCLHNDYHDTKKIFLKMYI